MTEQRTGLVLWFANYLWQPQHCWADCWCCWHPRTARLLPPLRRGRRSRCSAHRWNCWCCGGERTSGEQSPRVSSAAATAAPSASESVGPLQGSFSQTASCAVAAGCSGTVFSAAPVRHRSAPTCCVSDLHEFDPRRSVSQRAQFRRLSAQGPCVGPLLLLLPCPPLS